MCNGIYYTVSQNWWNRQVLNISVTTWINVQDILLIKKESCREPCILWFNLCRNFAYVVIYILTWREIKHIQQNLNLDGYLWVVRCGVVFAFYLFHVFSLCICMCIHKVSVDNGQHLVKIFWQPKPLSNATVSKLIGPTAIRIEICLTVDMDKAPKTYRQIYCWKTSTFYAKFLCFPRSSWMWFSYDPLQK